MNSGCYDSDISKIFVSPKVINLSGEIKSFTKDEVKFFYRGNNLNNKNYSLIILKRYLAKRTADKNQIKVYKMTSDLLKRKKETTI